MSRKYTKRADRKIDKLNVFKTATQLPYRISIFSFLFFYINNNDNDNNCNYYLGTYCGGLLKTKLVW